MYLYSNNFNYYDEVIMSIIIRKTSGYLGNLLFEWSECVLESYVLVWIAVLQWCYCSNSVRVVVLGLKVCVRNKGTKIGKSVDFHIHRWYNSLRCLSRERNTRNTESLEFKGVDEFPNIENWTVNQPRTISNFRTK